MALMATARRRFDVDEYYRMAEAGILREQDRVELIDGEILVMSPIGARHAACVSSANRALVHAVVDQAIVQPQGPVRLDRFNEPQPDLLLLRPRDDFYATRHPGPADVLLVVEISDSSLAYDRGRKAGLYAEWGVTEYWVADLPHNLLWRYVAPEDGTFRSVESYGPGVSLSPHALPSCVVPADAFLIGWQSAEGPTAGRPPADEPT